MKKVYLSPIFHKKQGPSLFVEFHIRPEGIELVELSLDEKPGLSWQIHGQQKNSKLEESIHHWIDAYCSGKEPKTDLTLILDTLPVYTQKVLYILKGIPFGQTASYRDLAKSSGKPKAARAVGNACARNPLPLIIPCHRVLATGGRIGGFSQGLPIKKRLLNFEGVSYLA